MSNHRLSATVLFLTLSISATAAGGKLGALRGAASGQSAPKQTDNSKPSAAPSPSEKYDEPKHETASTVAKLASVVSEVRKKGPRPSAKTSRGTQTNSGRPHRNHPPSRPQRSPLGFGHVRISSGPSCLPTIIEEHHYYAPEPVIVDVPHYAPGPIKQPSEICPAPVGLSLMAPVEDVVEAASPPCEVLVENGFASENDSLELLPPWHIRIGIDYASDVDDVSRMGFDLLANATAGLGVDTGLRLFREQGADFRDHLWIGDFNIVYELVPTEWIRPRVGAGINWLADGYGAEAGLNLTFGADLLLGPLTMTGEADFGTLGDADLIHGRLTAGLRQGHNVEWFAGYDYVDIGGVEIQGMVGGLRFRF